MKSGMSVAVACLCALAAAPGLALARGGNSSSGSGLSPYATDTGNDRSAGVNNGNYHNPRYDYYRRAYGPRWAPYRGQGRGDYGYPY